jgi:glycosyltransferase involved in cell wall biosynthesis
MAKSLGGTLFVHNGETFDYCYKETIESLCQFCDKVSVVDAGSTDTTTSVLKWLESIHHNLKVIYLPYSDWEAQSGWQKLAYFQNIAIEALDTDWNLLVQGDEILHDNSIKWVRKAIETDNEAFFCTRLNLWESPYLYIDVEGERNPCSRIIVRLAKSEYISYGDGESLAVPAANVEYIDKINIWHYGFIRDRRIMKDKVIHMQEKVFLVDHDKKLDGSDIFIPQRWFGPNDLKPIPEDHPKIMKDWILTRP